MTGGSPVAGARLIKIGTGIGGGLITGGRLHRGAQGAAGEIGHIVVDDDGPRCWCGSHGCAAEYAGGAALASLGHALASDGRSPYLAGLLAEGRTIGASEVAAGAAAGDPLCVDLLTRAGEAVGKAAASLVNVFNPSLVVVGGGVFRGRRHAAGRDPPIRLPARSLRLCWSRLLLVGACCPGEGVCSVFCRVADVSRGRGGPVRGRFRGGGVDVPGLPDRVWTPRRGARRVGPGCSVEEEGRIVTTTESTTQTRRCNCCGRDFPPREVAELCETPGVFMCAGCGLWAARRATTFGVVRRLSAETLQGVVHRLRPHRHPKLGPEAARAAIPVMTSTDLSRTAVFWAEFGFEETERHPGYLLLNGGDAELHFSQPDESDQPVAAGTCFIHVGDARQLWNRVTGSEVAGVGPIADADYGLREFVVTDPDGNRIRFGSPAC